MSSNKIRLKRDEARKRKDGQEMENAKLREY